MEFFPKLLKRPAQVGGRGSLPLAFSPRNAIWRMWLGIFGTGSSQLCMGTTIVGASVVQHWPSVAQLNTREWPRLMVLE